MLSDDAVSESRTWEKVEDGIGVSSLGLLVTEANWSLVLLHATVKGGSGWDVDGILADNVSLCDGELGDWERESVRRTGRQITLGLIWIAGGLILARIERGCVKQSRKDGGDGCSGELHVESCEESIEAVLN